MAAVSPSDQPIDLAFTRSKKKTRRLRQGTAEGAKGGDSQDLVLNTTVTWSEWLTRGCKTN